MKYYTAKRIKKKLIDLGLTQTEIAVELGVPLSTVNAEINYGHVKRTSTKVRSYLNNSDATAISPLLCRKILGFSSLFSG